jgi:hypothetical protein
MKTTTSTTVAEQTTIIPSVKDALDYYYYYTTIRILLWHGHNLNIHHHRNPKPYYNDGKNYYYTIWAQNPILLLGTELEEEELLLFYMKWDVAPLFHQARHDKGGGPSFGKETL